MSKSNEVTLFSNGIGHFRRIYNVPNKKITISIPFKRDNIGDVAASLQVFGSVRLNTPPSFTPMNANATALKINQNEAMRSLIRSLSGAKVTVNFSNLETKSCTLLGLDAESNVSSTGGEILTDYVILGTGGSVQRKRLSEVVDIHFDEESVRTEIEKALKNNFQQIKPDSTLLDLTLESISEAETEAIVQYTIPVAAWKMRYSIRESRGKFTLEGAAIIDNNTDEDWDNFKVSVVTGNPISFNTDIATVAVPFRQMIRLVDNNTLNNVTVEDGQERMYTKSAVASQVTALGRMQPTPAYGSNSSFSNVSGSIGAFGFEESANGNRNYTQAAVAESPGVESREVGDFCVFTSKEPITILARKSAVVPMFNVSLGSEQTGVVLLYKEKDHPTRPYRTIKFVNETEFSLGRGKTVIYNDGVFSGESILENAKPSECKMLPHCLENGVRITKESEGIESRRNSLKLSEGVAVIENLSTVVTKYKIRNQKKEPFKFGLEHSHNLKGNSFQIEFEGAKVLGSEKLVASNATRVFFDLPANGRIELVVTEQVVQAHEVVIGNFSWLATNVTIDNPISNDKQFVKVAGIQEKIDGQQKVIEKTVRRRTELMEQGNRVRQNITASKEIGNTTTIAEWIRDLDTTEKEIRKIDNDMLGFNHDLTNLQTNLKDEIKKISATWHI